VREQDHLGAHQGQDAPALEEVAVVADGRRDFREAQIEDRPFVGLAEDEELVVRRVRLALEADKTVRADERCVL
jgi:hypothetical protein